MRPSTFRFRKVGPWFGRTVPLRLFLAAPLFLLLQSPLDRPFLDQFLRQDTSRALTERAVRIEAGPREFAAFLVTPDEAAASPMPAVVLASGTEGLTDTLRQFAREIAGIGYVTLAVDYRAAAPPAGSTLLEQVLERSNPLDDVVAWLSAQPAVDRRRLGLLAWTDAFDDAQRLAGRGTVAALYPSTLVSQASMTEALWLDSDEYLDTQVDDALRPRPPASAEPPFVRVIDIMRAINSDQGVRGRLARALMARPSGDAEWEQARSDAAVLAEGSTLLLAQQPPKGSVEGWRRRATGFRSAAEALLRAIEARDFAAAQERLRELPRTCAACHAEYR